MTDCKQFCVYVVKHLEWFLAIWVPFWSTSQYICTILDVMFCGAAKEWYPNVVPGHSGMILLVLCFIDSSAMLHYAKHGSGDGLRSVP